MVLRDLTIGDLAELEKQAQFPINFLLHMPKLIQKTFEDDEGLLGSVVVTRTVELTMIFNDRSDRDKIKVMMEVPDLLYHELVPKGYRDIHTFVKDEKFADILIKHFNFEPVVGKALVRRY